MFDLFNSQTGWLTLTNAVLGLAVFVCILAVGRVVIQELRVWASNRIHKLIAHDDHAFDLKSLGITMADGGEPINEMTRGKKNLSSDLDDPKNIQRSDN